MYWMVRPSLARPLAAALLLVVAILFDLSDTRTEQIPFATQDLSIGQSLSTGSIEFRDVPVGLLSGAALDGPGVLGVTIAAGEPILASAVFAETPIPAAWWSVPLDLPDGMRVGQRVRLVDADGSLVVEGIVAAPAASGALGVRNPGLVAVPPNAADRVAASVRNGSLTVLLGQ